MQEKKLKTLLCMSVNKKFLCFCLHFSFKELKIYDATVAKTSLKIASSSLLICFVIDNLFNFLKLAGLPRN